MAADLIYAFRVMRLPLLDAGGAPIGRLEDIVVIPGRAGKGREPAVPPRVVGFVASSQRRRIFVSANRIAELDSDGARLRSWDVDLNPFKPRSGEVLIGGELIDRKIGDETVSDIALRPQENARSTYWVIDKVRLARKSTLRRRPSYRLVDFDEVPALFDAQTAMQAEAARLREFHPAEVAAIVRALPIDQRRQLAEAMDDERLADVLEELPEEEQVRIVEQLDRDRLVGVFDEMEYDDLADLLGRAAPTPDQVEIIESPLCPLLVVAGAGSGKTETMAARVVWLIANGIVAPEQVLGLTFTRKAAGELGDRIRLTEHFLDPGVFIRSMANRGALGSRTDPAGRCGAAHRSRSRPADGGDLQLVRGLDRDRPRAAPRHRADVAAAA